MAGVDRGIAAHMAGMSGKSGKQPTGGHPPDISMRSPRLTLRAIAGVAIAGLSAGPFMVTYVGMINLLSWGSISTRLSVSLAAIALTSTYAIPVAIVNAVVLSMLARRGKDSVAFALCSGASLGIAIMTANLVIAGPPTIYDAPEWLIWAYVMHDLLLLVFTGISMSIPQWLIAIRPSRRFRLSHARDQEAIRAMS